MKKKDDMRLPKKNIAYLFILFLLFIAAGIAVAIIYANTSVKNPNAVGGSTAIVFNEIMSSNRGTLIDPAGAPSDWLELYNDADVDADVSGFVVINGSLSLTLPSNTVISARGYLIVYCVGTQRGGLYAPFTLAKAGGETLTLKNRDGSVIDSVTTQATQSNQSLIPNNGEWVATTLCTPGYSNDEAGFAALTASRKTDSSDIVINEFMAANKLTIADSDGVYSDWIEIKNKGTKAINLQNYSLSDDETAPFKWQLPRITLEPGKCLLVFASEKDISDSTAELHTNFKLKAAGGSVVLSGSNGKILDSFSYVDLCDDQAYARSVNGEFAKTYEPTPGFDNSDYDAAAQQADKSKKTLVINEAMSKNQSYLKQNGGNCYDWVELKNVSDKPINLSSYYLSNDSDEPLMWQLPDIELGAGNIYVVVASGNTALSNSSYKHTSFKINDSEEVFLYNSERTQLDGMCLKATPIDYSLGRSTGESGLFYISSPTPGENNASGTRAVSETPTINTKAGVYNNVSSVTVSASGEGTLYYTLDGSAPTRTSTEYTGEVSLTSTKVFRVASYCEGKLHSTVSSASYIINENHSVPVMSVTLDPDDMYGYSHGIYVKGPGASSVFPYEGANFWQDWEKEAYADFFEEGRDGFSIPCGIKIFGQYSRGEDKKSFQLKFRDLYGESNLVYNVFDDPDISTYNALVLRSGSQDYNKAMMRDEVLTSLSQSAEGTTLYTQAYKPCVLYINGEYFGVYYLREKVSEDYVSQHLNVKPETTTLLQANYTVIYGTNDEYIDLLSYVTTHSLANDEYYAYIADRIDIDNYIDYNIARIFSADQDTGNIKFFKSTDGDGKWRWLYYDVDWAFYYDTPINFYIKEEGRPGFAYIYTLIANLLKNATFRDRFLTRFASLMKTTYSAENVTKSIDGLAGIIRPEMERNSARWGTTLSSWERQVATLKENASKRADFLLKDIKSELNMSAEEYNRYFGG